MTDNSNTTAPQPLSIWQKLNEWVNAVANPGQFLKYSSVILPWLGGLAVLGLITGLYWAFFITPVEEEMGKTVLIMFVHVPAAWISQMCYVLIAASSFGLLVWRHPLADVSAKAAAPIGAIITFLCLVTGSLWGRPDWGTYWQWDLRMTSVLVLFFLYIGLITLRNAIDEEVQAGKVTAILALVGVVLLPVIKWSVEWQQSALHQKAGIIRGEVSVDYLIPLLIMALSYTALFFYLHMKAMRAEIYRRRTVAQQRRLAYNALKDEQQPNSE
ncbi:MAG: heme exporter C (cytochrome C-type biogenesis protein) transmembrane [Rhodomicrobium sp.]|nr:MAG: heme exporter C (cytochrome C-type biogenesis protein) transmembrane [Rhodomicrobium sp.]